MINHIYLTLISIILILTDKLKYTHSIETTIQFDTLLSSIKQSKNLIEHYPFCYNQCIEFDDLHINCINLNQTNFECIKNINQNIHTITFTGNQLNQINEHIFANEMKYLEKLNLSNNQIKYINSSIDIFKQASNLNELILDNNQLNLNQNLNFISSLTNLTSLSLNNVFKPKTVKETYLLIENLNKLFKNLTNLKRLTLKNNSLTKFDLCSFNQLEYLNLEFNYIDTIEFDLNKCNLNTLKYLNLKSNKLDKINYLFLNNLINLNFDIEIYLANNPFNCDCNLYNFYKFLLLNDTRTNVIIDKSELECINENSFKKSLNKKLIDSNLNIICSISKEEDKGIFYLSTIKTRRYKNTSTRTYPSNVVNYHHSYSKLIIFLFSCLMISALIILVTKLNYKKLILKCKIFNFYKRIHNTDNTDNDESFDRVCFNGANMRISLDNNDTMDLVDDYSDEYFNELNDEQKKKRPINFLSRFKIFNRNNNNNNNNDNKFKRIVKLKDINFGQSSQFSLTESILNREVKKGKKLKANEYVNDDDDYDIDDEIDASNRNDVFKINSDKEQILPSKEDKIRQLEKFYSTQNVFAARNL